MNYLAERRQEEKDRRRDEILDAAASVAATHGMAEFTMDQVARKARLSRALLYVYFRDKEDLLMGLADRGHRMLEARFVAICAKRQTGLKMILAMGRGYVAFASESPMYFEALACFAAHEPGKQDKDTNVGRCLESGDRIMALMVQALDTGVADGSIRRDIGSPLLVAVTLWGFMHGIIQLISTKGEVLEHKGATSKQLVDNALALAMTALQKQGAKGR